MKDAFRVSRLEGVRDLYRQLERILEQIGSDDVLLFSTDYPHWHFDGDDALPDGLPASLVRKITEENPLATYSRLRETVA